MKPYKSMLHGVTLASLVVLGSPMTHAGSLLREYAFNIDGSITDTFNPPGGLTGTVGVTYNTFNPNTGLGSLTITVMGLGAHNLGVFFDHDLGPLINDEVGSTVGSPVAGQRWEIDEPGYGNNGYFGDIYANFASVSLDNAVNTGGTGTTATSDDVGLALSWSFNGPADLQITVSQTAPAAGFYLVQSEDGTVGSEKLYLSGILTPRGGGGTGAPDGGATVVSFALGLAGLVVVRSRRGR